MASARLEAVEVDVRRDAHLLGETEREAERLSGLAERLVACDERRARGLDVLTCADDVESGGATQGGLPLRELESGQRVQEADPVELRDALGGDGGDDH